MKKLKQIGRRGSVSNREGSLNTAGPGGNDAHGGAGAGGSKPRLQPQSHLLTGNAGPCAPPTEEEVPGLVVRCNNLHECNVKLAGLIEVLEHRCEEIVTDLTAAGQDNEAY